MNSRGLVIKENQAAWIRDQAIADGILATPTIVRETPTPEARVIGGCSDMAPVLARLGLGCKPEPSGNTCK